MSLTATEEALLRELIDQQAALLSLAGSESTIISKLGATKVNLSELHAASSLDDADILLVRQGTSDKSVTADVIKTFSAPADASTTTKGIVELATATETATGTDTTRAVTPAGLAALTASETRAGLVELATDAEAQALTDGTKIITALKLATAFQGANVSKNAHGYQKLPSGLIIQWGNTTISTGGSIPIAVTLPLTFPTAQLMTIGSSISAGGSFCGATNQSTSSILVWANNAGAGLTWISIGY